MPAPTWQKPKRLIRGGVDAKQYGNPRGHTRKVSPVVKVGPKGYIHGWIYVGPQAPGSRVFHPEHGHGTVKHVTNGQAHVDFDNGAEHSFDVRHRSTATAHHFEPAAVRPTRQRVVSSSGKLQSSLSTEERRQLDAGVKAAKKSMTPGQRKAVEQWTSGKGMVRKIQTGKVSQETARNFDDAMQAAPKVDGLVYRGVSSGSLGAKLAGTLRPGDKVSLGEPVSTSIEPKQSAGFGTYLFEIESPAAAYISGLGSKYTYEKEAVLAPGSFEVVSVEDGKIGLGSHTAPVRIIRLRDTSTGTRSWLPTSGSDFAVTKAEKDDDTGDEGEARPDRFVQDDGPGQFVPEADPAKNGGHESDDAVTKVDEGAAGDYKARHLIRWFNEGADGEIPWGSPGDFEACVRIAEKHMLPGKAKGFCANRHHDALGIWPATHAAEEHGGKSGHHKK